MKTKTVLVVLVLLLSFGLVLSGCDDLLNPDDNANDSTQEENGNGDDTENGAENDGDSSETVIGTVSGESDFAIVRERESAIGNAIADSMMWIAQEHGKDPDFAVQNGGGIRADFSPGDLTVSEIYEVLPFEDTVVVVDVTGSQVLALFDHAANSIGQGSMAQISSTISVIFNSFDETHSNLTINGESVNAEQTYTVVTDSYVGAGNDGYTMLGEGSSFSDLGITQQEAFIQYVQEELDGSLVLQTDGRLSIHEWALFSVVSTDDSTKRLVEIDHHTGEQSVVDEFTQSQDSINEALTYDSQSEKFLSNDPWEDNTSDQDIPTEISRIDVQQGSSDIVATIPYAIGGIAYYDGQLYGLSMFGNSLGHIDLAENEFNSIEIDLDPLDRDFRFQHFDISPDGIVYIIARERETEDKDYYLVTVDLSSAAATSQILLIDEEDGEPLSLTLGDVAYGSDGYLYASNYSSLLVRIAPDTGLASWVGWGSVGSFSNLAFGLIMND